VRRAAQTRLCELPIDGHLSMEAVAEQGDAGGRKTRSDEDVRPVRLADQLRRNPACADPDRDRSQSRPTPGEVRALTRQPGAAERIGGLGRQGIAHTAMLRPGHAGPGGVRELAELAGDEVGRLLADVDGVVADPLEAAGDDQHS
jgi:hypothetical protein